MPGPSDQAAAGQEELAVQSESLVLAEALVELPWDTFEGGPVPIHGLTMSDQPPHSEEPHGSRRMTMEDLNFLIRCGGAGAVAETPEEQRKRYAGVPADSPELDPGSLQNLLAAPDLFATCSVDYTIRTWDPKNNFKQVQIFEGHIGPVGCIRPYHGDRILSCSDDFSVRLWKIGTSPSGELLLTFYVTDWPIKCVQPLAGERCAAGSMDKLVRVICLRNATVLHIFDDHRSEQPVRTMYEEGMGTIYSMLDLKPNILVTGSEDASIRFYDVDKGQRVAWMVGHSGWGRDICHYGIDDPRPMKWADKYAPVWQIIHVGKGGDQMASCSYDRTISIWDTRDVRNVTALRTWKGHENSCLGMRLVSPQHICTFGSDRVVRVWDFETGEMVEETETRGISSSGAYYGPNKVCIAGGDATIRLWDWEEDEDLLGVTAHDFFIYDMIGIHHAFAKEDLWLQTPIMYKTCKDATSKLDAYRALNVLHDQWRTAVYNEQDPYSLEDAYEPPLFQ